MTDAFGWTTDPAILAIMEELWGTGDDILSNRKCGGVHRVWVWPLGHPDNDDWTDATTDEPYFVRADVAHGRYLKDGCTFLIWDWDNGGEIVRAGTLEDAVWLQKGVNEETERGKLLAKDREYQGLYKRLRDYLNKSFVVPEQMLADFQKEVDAYYGDEHRYSALQALIIELDKFIRFERLGRK